MDWQSFLKRNRSSFDSPYEETFVESVLAMIDDLDFDNVKCQVPFKDSRGGPRRFDFGIIEGDDVRIAIEVDGWDKTGLGVGMSPGEFRDWHEREQALKEQDWALLRFPNTQVIHSPTDCVRHVSLILERERNRAKQLSQRDESSSAPNTLSEAQQEELEELEQRNQAELEKLKKALREEEQRRKFHEEETSHMKLVVICFTILVLALIGAGMWFSTHSVAKEHPDSSLSSKQASKDGGTASTPSNTREPWLYAKKTDPAYGQDARKTPITTRPNTPPAEFTGNQSFCEGGTSWSAVSSNDEGELKVYGPVVSTKYLPSSSGQPTFLNLGRRFPDKARVEIVIWGRNRDNFESPESFYQGDTVCVSGKMHSYKGTPSIEVREPSQIEVRP